MLHPKQFQVNEAWLAFHLNEAPMQIESEGSFDCFALMDAASCYILTTLLLSATEGHPSKPEATRLLRESHAHKRVWPKTLFIPSGLSAVNLTQQAERKGITVVSMAETHLLPFISEARQFFKERFGRGAPQ